MRYTTEHTSLFYQHAWEHVFDNVCVVVRPLRARGEETVYHSSAESPNKKDLSGKKIIVRAGVSSHCGASKRKERQVRSWQEAVVLAHDLNTHDRLHDAVVVKGITAPPLGCRHFYSDEQKNRSIVQNGRRLPQPFRGHK